MHKSVWCIFKNYIESSKWLFNLSQPLNNRKKCANISPEVENSEKKIKKLELKKHFQLKLVWVEDILCSFWDMGNLYLHGIRDLVTRNYWLWILTVKVLPDCGTFHMCVGWYALRYILESPFVGLEALFIKYAAFCSSEFIK